MNEVYQTPKKIQVENTTYYLLLATDTQKQLGNRFNKIHKQTSAGKQDLLFLLKKDTQIIGSARLEVLDSSGKSEPLEAFYWLRNVFIHPDCRHQKLGSALVKFMQSQMQIRPTYCFPHDYLNNFYEALGFQSCTVDALPEPLKNKLIGYQNNGKHFIAMQFNQKLRTENRQLTT